MNPAAEYTLRRKIAARDKTIARLEAALLEKRRELAAEVMAHEATKLQLHTERAPWPLAEKRP